MPAGHRLGFRAALLPLLTIILGGAGPAENRDGTEDGNGPRLPVEELLLDNGMRFLLVPRPGATTVSAGWVARAGSADEEPGRTGLGHLIEHLLFKGTRTVGTSDPDREAELLDEEDRLTEELRRLRADAKGGGKRQARLEELETRLASVRAEARSLARLGELSLLYSEAGATGLNAHTLEDLTMFLVRLPAEKLELWFWLESDRLLEPVFRELHHEKRVIAEERRMRIESSPTGPLDDELRTRFWRATPYEWRPMGRPEDLERLGRDDARRFFAEHYTADRLTAVLVGDFALDRARELARAYFGRLPGGGRGAETSPPPFPGSAAGGRRMVAACDCPPQAQVLYRTVPFRHPDSYRLQVLAGLLNGRTGRLHRSLVLDRKIAYSASVLQYPMKRAGFFIFHAEGRGGADPGGLVTAWREEIARLAEQPVPVRELEKVKNQVTADAYRRLLEPPDLVRQLLIYDGLGDWRHIHDWPERILEVSAEEVRETARRYLLAGEGFVGLYHRGETPAAREAAEGVHPSRLGW